MMGKIRPLVFSFFCFATFLAGSLCAQSDAKILLANLKQDLELVSRDLNSLRSEWRCFVGKMLNFGLRSIRTIAPKTLPSRAELFRITKSFTGIGVAFRQSEKDRGSRQEEISKKFNK